MLKRSPELTAQEVLNNLLAYEIIQTGVIDAVGEIVRSMQNGIKRICYDSFMLDPGDIPKERKQYISQLSRQKGVTRESLAQKAWISDNTLQNMMNPRHRCDKQTAYRVMTVLSGNTRELDRLYQLFGLSPLEFNEADQIIRFCVEHGYYDDMDKAMGNNGETSVFWLVFLSILSQYNKDAQRAFGTLKNALQSAGIVMEEGALGGQ